MPGSPVSERSDSDENMPASESPAAATLPVPTSTSLITHEPAAPDPEPVPATYAANFSAPRSTSKYDTIGVPSEATAMLVYMPTSGPSSVTPPRIIEPGTVTGPDGTPSTHCHAVSSIRPGPLTCATATSEYGPSWPIGTSVLQMHMLSTQNGSWPIGHSVQSLVISHACLLLLQLQLGAIDTATVMPAHVATRS